MMVNRPSVDMWYIFACDPGDMFEFTRDFPGSLNLAPAAERTTSRDLREIYPDSQPSLAPWII